MKQLAEADMQEVVKEIKEIYIDYLPIGKSIFLPSPSLACHLFTFQNLLQAPISLVSLYSTLSSPWEAGQFYLLF